MIKSLFIINGKSEENYLLLFKDKFICSDEEIPKELCLLEDDDLEKKVLELIKNDKECKLALGPQKALFFADLDNPDKKLKNLPLHEVIKCNIFSIDQKYFIDKVWHFKLISISIIVIAGAITIYMNTKGYRLSKYFITFGIIMLLINCYIVKILEKIYYKKALKKLKS